MTDLILIIYIIFLVIILCDEKSVTVLKDYRKANMLRIIYFILSIIGVAFCLISNVMKTNISMLFYCWTVSIMFLNIMSKIDCLKFLKHCNSRTLILGVLSTLLLIITLIILVSCIYSKEKDLSGMLLLTIGSGIISFAFLLSVYVNYHEQNS